MGDSKIEPRRKAEEIAHTYNSPGEGYDHDLQVANEALEWAARQCDAEAKICREKWWNSEGEDARKWDWAATTAESLALVIRKGKS